MSTDLSKNDDTVPVSYPYSWSPEESSLSIEEFVTKHKPSMVQNDGTKPWLWVRNSNSKEGREAKDEAVEEAANLLAEVTEEVEKIKNDDSIPTRSNKKTGTKSKKELREQVQLEATKKLKEIHKRHDYISGKWLIFAPSDKIDNIWARIAISVVTGPLSKTAVTLAKVATTPMNESSAQRLICIYMPDVFDEPKVVEVMTILLRNHGVNLSGVKSDLYTHIGLDSKHASGIPSTVWKNSALMDDKKIKDLKEAFFAELKAEQDPKAKKVPAKPKGGEDDPFASDSDGDEEEPKSKVVPKSAIDDPFTSDEEKPKAKARKVVPKRRKDGDEEEEEAPKKKAQKKK